MDQVIRVNDAINVAAGLCKQFEGFRSKPYLCPAGVPTIGYGSTFYKDGSPVKLSDPEITEAKSTELLLNTLSSFYKQMVALCPEITKESPNRQGAILDFTYNLGAGNLQSSTLRKRINAGEWNQVPTELRKWVKGGGKVLPGLVKRREAECNLI